MTRSIFTKLIPVLEAISVGASFANAAEAPPTLASQLEELRERFDAEAPKKMKDALEKDIASAAKSGITEKAIGVGKRAPIFSLKNAVGDEVALAALLENGPVVLTFYRGGWCPYCNAALRAYEKALGEISKAGGQLVAISPELPDKSLSTKEKNDLNYEILSDAGQTVARTFGVVVTITPEMAELYQETIDLKEYNGPDAAINELPFAATCVIDSSGVIRWAFLDADFRKRAEPRDIVAALTKLRDENAGR